MRKEDEVRKVEKLEDERMKNWSIGGFEYWRIGGLVECKWIS